MTLASLEAALLVFTQFPGSSFSAGQTHDRGGTIRKSALVIRNDTFDRTVNSICSERQRDMQGTIPIDEMASSRSLPLSDPRAVSGRLRAQTMLPVAKRLLPFALKRLASSRGLDLNLTWVVPRIRSVDVIKADVEERDNAAWRSSDPRAIIFGTIFLAGLRSDEAMLAVLAHELTHAVDGTDERLQPLFSRLGQRASQSGTPVGFRAATELSCDLAGIEVVRDYISQTTGRGNSKQRLARALEKDCVHIDLSDENHLSPLETMRTVLSIEPDISSAFAGERIAKHLLKQKRQRTKKRRKK